jgi:superfamily II DNA or RNA helicase
MLKDVEWSEERSYRSGSENEAVQFYLDALCNSAKFDLLLGYFSSSAINILSLGFASFLYAGGTIRMVINNVLSQEDRDAIKAGKEQTFTTGLFDLSDIKNLRITLDEYGKHFFECISWLISNNRIQIKIIKPKDGKGISHYKSGVFYDGSDYVGFKASCNFTAFGLLENLEELDGYLSWENGRSNKWIRGQNKYFENIFSGKADFVEYLDVQDISIAIRSEFGDKSINELVIQERELVERKKKILKNIIIKRSFERIIDKLEVIARIPRFPYIQGPRKYQAEAYTNWCNNDYKGIFAMATGTGKTITALNCVLNEYLKQQEKVYHALILVPTITLVEQWEKEAKSFNFQEVYKISSRQNWENELNTLISRARRIPLSFIIISTYASFVKNKFQLLLKNFPTDTIFIADEGHNLASPNVKSKLIDFSLQKRIGLSATPKRIYDPHGTNEMEGFFNDHEPYTYSFTMERAIEEDILCKYYYYPNIVSLTDEELVEYIKITKQLAKIYARTGVDSDSNEIAERLLLKRKRIIHKAFNKLESTKKILKTRFEKDGNLKYTFVYVPEGSTSEINENGEETDENIKIINQYTREIGNIDQSILVNQFVSGMQDRDTVLDQFKEGRIHVIASMKCLDEGIDIPRAEHAIFCSSTGNPRQFIQRRGRILRKHPDKHLAKIHDLVVIPDLTLSSIDSETFETERKMVKKELERVMYFASLSENPYLTEEIFKEVCLHYNLNIYTIHNELKNK